MVDGGHAAVVEIREIRPHAGEGRRRVAVTLDERAVAGERTSVERGDELIRDDVEAGSIGADVGVHARPLHVAAPVVDPMIFFNDINTGIWITKLNK